MTTSIPFAPVNSATAPPFQFAATFDGNSYTVQVKWNISGQRFYVHIYDNSFTLILCIAMAASPPGFDINLVTGVFTTSTLIFRDNTQNFEVSP
jgi:Domain of unknown function (DUF6983)